MKNLLSALSVVFAGTAFAASASAQSTPVKNAPAPSVYGMAKAFDQGKDFVAVDQWKGEKPLQIEFVRDFIGLGKEANTLPKSMLEAVASDDEKVINSFLQAHGLTIKLPQFGRDEFGAASVLTLEGKWGGRKTELTGEDSKKYPAVKLSNVAFYEVSKHADPVVLIYRERDSGVSVYVTPWDGDDSGFNALKKAQQLTPERTSPRHQEGYSALVMPMVDMDRSVDLDWLVGMRGSGATLQKALAQTKLKLDENGFSVKEGFAYSASRGLSTTYTINKPFLLWVRVEGLSQPFFAVKVGTEYWKNPNSK